jgi:hypothetical protein
VLSSASTIIATISGSLEISNVPIRVDGADGPVRLPTNLRPNLDAFG